MLKNQLIHHAFVYIFIRHIQFLWHRNPNFVVQETNDGNHPGLGLDINIINQIDDGDDTEGIDSGKQFLVYPEHSWLFENVKINQIYSISLYQFCIIIRVLTHQKYFPRALSQSSVASPLSI